MLSSCTYACVHSAYSTMNLYLLGNSLTIAPKYQWIFQGKTSVKLIVLANRFAHDAHSCLSVVPHLKKKGY